VRRWGLTSWDGGQGAGRASTDNLQAPRVDLPLFYSRWRSLLRGLSSLENYRKVHGAAEALRFLLLDPRTPRSLYFGTAAVKDLLERISGHRELAPPREFTLNTDRQRRSKSVIPIVFPTV